MPIHAKTKDKFPYVMSTKETLNYIVTTGCSVSRFGDGELWYVMGGWSHDFYEQKQSAALQKRLIEILTYKSTRSMLIAIPPLTQSIKSEAKWWKDWWGSHLPKLHPYFIHPAYGNSMISRPLAFAENTTEDIKRLWHQKDVVFVYGKGGHFEANCPLFDNIKSKKVILTPAKDAFEQYETILKECLKEQKHKTFLIACGACATVLAFDLHRHGYQALDIGHINMF